MVVDASAIVALLDEEADADIYAQAFLDNPESIIAPFNYVESGIVLINRGRVRSPQAYKRIMARLGVSVSALEVSEGAFEAYLIYGKGSHRARLNIGDCFAYALAKRVGAPLLFKGEDFIHTDVGSVLSPRDLPRGSGGR